MLVAASDPDPTINLASLASPLSETVVAPAEPDVFYGRLVDSATPVFILDDPMSLGESTTVRVAFASFGTNASVTCIILTPMLVTWTSTPYRCEVRYHAYLPPPISIIVQSASRPSFIKPPSLPLLPAKLLNKDFYRLCSVVVTCNERGERSPSPATWRNVRVFLTISVTCAQSFRSRLTPVEDLPNGLPPGTGPTVDSEVLDLLRRQGSQSSRRLPTRPIE
jgi:hypothetical protein